MSEASKDVAVDDRMASSSTTSSSNDRTKLVFTKGTDGTECTLSMQKSNEQAIFREGVTSRVGPGVVTSESDAFDVDDPDSAADCEILTDDEEDDDDHDDEERADNEAEGIEVQIDDDYDDDGIEDDVEIIEDDDIDDIMSEEFKRPGAIDASKLTQKNTDGLAQGDGTTTPTSSKARSSSKASLKVPGGLDHQTESAEMQPASPSSSQHRGVLSMMLPGVSPHRRKNKVVSSQQPKSPRGDGVKSSSAKGRRRKMGSAEMGKSPLGTPLQRMKALALGGGSSHKRSSRKRGAAMSIQVPDLNSSELDMKNDEGSDFGESSSDSESDHSDAPLNNAAGGGSSSHGLASNSMDVWGDEDAVVEAFASKQDITTSVSRLPNSFLNITPDLYDYLDQDLVKNIKAQDFSVFAWEHHMMVKGVLQLLAERDHIGVEADINDETNIVKKGPLKKKFAKLYFVKYVEIRKGNLVYYEDTDRGEEKGRKMIHLRRYTCKCKISGDSAYGSSGGFCFDIISEGQKTRWLAKSEEERQGWIRAINQAMVGDLEDEMQEPLDLNTHESALDAYHSYRSSFQGVDSAVEYRVAAQSVVYQQRAAASLRVPLQWVREMISLQNGDYQNDDSAPMPPKSKQRVQTSISEFWKNLSNASVAINGHLVEARSSYSAERVIGALTRCILEYDRCDPLEEDLPSFKRAASISRFDMKDVMTEVQAMSYSRTLLTSILRYKNRKDALACLRNMCANQGVVCVKEMSDDPIVRIDVSFAGDDFSEYEPRTNDVTGWLTTKTRKTKKWRERFFVISEGVLSLYEKATPRPHGLRGQMVLGGATMKSLDDKILQIQTKKRDHERQLRFNSRGDFIKWREVLLRTIDSTGMNVPIPEVVAGPNSQPSESNSGKSRRSQLKSAGEAGVKMLKDAAGGGIKAMKGATASGMKAMKGATNAGMKSIKEASGKVAKSIRGPKNEGKRGRPSKTPTEKLDMLITSTRNIQGKREPTVQVVVESTSVFRIVADAKQSKGGDDGPILSVQAKIFQAFLLSGGPTGRLAKGDALIELEFQGGGDSQSITAAANRLEPPLVL